MTKKCVYIGFKKYIQQIGGISQRNANYIQKLVVYNQIKRSKGFSAVNQANRIRPCVITKLG